MSGYIDNYGNPIDITGSPLEVVLNFQDKGASAPTDHPLSAFSGLISFPPVLTAALQQPLNQLFDQFWAQSTGSISAAISNQISSGVQGLGGGYSAYNIGVTLPGTGDLRALVLTDGLTNPNASQLVLLSYEIRGISANFAVTTPYTGGALPDPTYNVSFDIAVLFEIAVPFFAPSPPNSFATTVTTQNSNANINGTNPTAEGGDVLANLGNFLSGQPPIFRAPEGQIDSASVNLTNLGQVATLLSQLASAWYQAAQSLGFTQLSASIDGTPALKLSFIHPVATAPNVFNAAVSPWPSLFPAQLGTGALPVQAGNPLGVNGTNFPVGQASALYIAWADSISATVIQSTINWGRVDGPLTTVNKKRNGNDGGDTFAALNLAANTQYFFSVVDQDPLTETPPGTLVLTTSPTNLVEFLLASSSGGQQSVVGTASLTGSGNFIGTANIPPATAAGKYTLSAAVAGSILASITIQVVAAGQPVPPTVEVIDPATNTNLGEVEETYTFTLRGAGFQFGPVNIAIDSVVGQPLGAAAAGSDGTFQANFTWPLNVAGNHAIFAQQVAGSQTYVADVTVFAQGLPQ
jgi:hypothetical protein